MPPAATNRVSLRELADLAIGTPEVGAVNFTALHTLIVAMLKSLKIQESVVDLQSLSPEAGRSLESLRAAFSGAPVVAPKEKDREKRRTGRAPQALESQVQDLSKQVKTIDSKVHTIITHVQNITSQTGGLQVESPEWLEEKEMAMLVPERAQITSFGALKDTGALGPPKAMRLLQDVIEDVKNLKETQQKIQELSELKPQEILQRVEDLERVVKDREEFLEHISWKLGVAPGREEVTMVTWEELEQAITDGWKASQASTDKRKGPSNEIPSGVSTTKHPSTDQSQDLAGGQDQSSSEYGGTGQPFEGVTPREWSKRPSATRFPTREQYQRAHDEASMARSQQPSASQVRGEPEHRRGKDTITSVRSRRDERDTSQFDLPSSKDQHQYTYPDQLHGAPASQGQVSPRPDHYGVGPPGIDQPGFPYPSIHPHAVVPHSVGQLGVLPPDMDNQGLVSLGMDQHGVVPLLVPGRDQQGLELPGTEQLGMVPLGTFQQDTILPGTDQRGMEWPGMDEGGVGPLGMDQQGLIPLGTDQRGFVMYGTGQQGLVPPGMDQQGLVSPDVLQVGADQQGSTQPTLEAPGLGQHDLVQPGMAQPGTGQRGVVRPGAHQPGLVPPGAGQPGLVQPGTYPPSLAQLGVDQHDLVQPGADQGSLVQPGAYPPGLVQPGTVQPGVVQHGLVQPGMGQRGLVQPGADQRGLVQPGMGQHGLLQPGADQHGLVQPGMGQHGLVQPGADQRGLVQPGTGQRGLVQPHADQHGLVQPGMGQHGLVQPGADQHGLVQPGMSQHGLVQPGADQRGLVQPGADQRGLVQPGADQRGLVQPGADQRGLVQPGADQRGLVQPGADQRGLVQPGADQRGLVQPGADQRGLVQPGADQRGLVQPGADQRGLVQPGADQRGLVQPGADQRGLVQPGADQRGLVQPGADQRGLVQPGADQRGLVQPGADQRGLVQPGADQRGLVQPGADQRGVVQPGADQRGLVQPGADQRGLVQPGADQRVLVQPGAGQRGVVQPGADQRGLVQPGAGQRGLVQPGAGQRGLVQPGAGQRGLVQPGAGQRGLVQPGVDQRDLVQPGARQPGGLEQSGADQHGLVQPGMDQYGLVPPGAIQGGLMPPGMDQHGLVQPGTDQPGGLVPPGTDQHGLVQPGMGQRGLVQPGMYPRGLVQPGLYPRGLVQPGMYPRGLVQPGMGQHGLVQPGAGQRGLVQPGMGQRGLVQPGMGQRGLVHPGADQLGLVQPGADQRGLVQFSADQRGLVQPGMDQSGLVQPGADQFGREQPGVGQPGMAQSGIYMPGLAQPGAYPPGLVQPGAYPPGLVQPGAYPPGLVQPGAYPSGLVQPGAYPSGLVQPGAYPSGLVQPGMDQPAGVIASGTELHDFPTSQSASQSLISPHPSQYGVVPPVQEQRGRTLPFLITRSLESPSVSQRGLLSSYQPGLRQKGPTPSPGLESAYPDQQQLAPPGPDQQGPAHPDAGQQGPVHPDAGQQGPVHPDAGQPGSVHSVLDYHGPEHPGYGSPGYPGIDLHGQVLMDLSSTSISDRPELPAQPDTDLGSASFIRSLESLSLLRRASLERTESLSGTQTERQGSLVKVAPSFPIAVETFRLIGEMIGLYMELKENIKDLEEEEAGQTDLEKIQYLLGTMVKNIIPPDLPEQLKLLKTLTKEVRQDKVKLDRLQKLLEGEGDREGGKELKSSQLGLQLSVLRVTVADIEKELSELRESQERGKATMENSVAEASLYLQDQLDKLRTIIENMLASSSTLLSMSLIPHKTLSPIPPGQIDPEATCPACSLDLGHQVSTLVQRYEQLQDMVNSLAASRPSKKAKLQSQDEELLGHVQSAILQVQGDCEKLNITTCSLIEDHRQKQKDIDVLYQGLEKLEKEKANREHLEMEIDVKADKSALAAKVSRVQFDATTEQLNHMMKELVAKMSGQEQDWQKMLDKLLVEMDSKLDRLELDPVKQSLEDRWKSLRQQLKERSPMYQADEAAIMRRQLLAHFHCLSCDRPLETPVTGQMINVTPVGPSLPGHRSIRPYTVFELEQIRQQSRNLRLGSTFSRGDLSQMERSVGRLRTMHSKMLMDIEKVQIHFGGSVKASSQMIRELLQAQCLNDPRYKRVPDAMMDYTFSTVPRRCGGSHTLTYPYRRNRLQHLSQGLYAPEEIQTAMKHDEVDILGLDGHIYKGRMDTRLPGILTKDTSGAMKHKSKQSRPNIHRTQAHGHSSQPPSRPQSARISVDNNSVSSRQQKDRPVSSEGRLSQSAHQATASEAGPQGREVHRDLPVGEGLEEPIRGPRSTAAH